MRYRIVSFILVIILLIGCQSRQFFPDRIILGVVSFGDTEKLAEKYGELKTYLENELNSIVQLEPTYNERQAISQIKDNAWDLVFASPGLAAIAVEQGKYKPMLPLEGGLNNRSVFVIRQDSPLTSLKQLNGKTVGIGQSGSATGYYFALYNLYGLTLAEVRESATPRQALEWVAKGEVATAAMSLEQYNRYRSQVAEGKFRVLFQDVHQVPNGAVLVSDKLSQMQQEALYTTLAEAPPMISASVGYIANAPVPDYKRLRGIINQVTQISEKAKQKPAVLFERSNS